MKKVFSFILSLTFALAYCCVSFVSVSATTEDNYSEDIIIDGTLYHYNYFYDDNNNIEINIVNTVTNAVDDVEIIDEKIYVNDDLVGTIENVPSEIDNINGPRKSYSYRGQKSKYISWAKGTTAAVVAAVIGAALGGMGGGLVGAAMGAAALGTLAAQTTGGTVTYKVYEQKTGKLTQYKWVWKFKASTGDTYGWYTSYTSV